MDKQEKTKALILANPKSQSEVAKIQEAISLIRQRRDLGKGPKEYELATPFGDRNWLRRQVNRRSN